MKDLRFRHDLVIDYFQKHYQDQADRAMAELAILQLVSQREISAMTGGELLGMHLTQFVELMTRHGIPYFTEAPRDSDDLRAQFQAKRLVSDVSPLISLARIGAFSLHERLFGPTTLAIPPAVYNDVVTRGMGRPGEAEVKAGLAAGWIQIKISPACNLAHRPDRATLRQHEAVSLACQLDAELLIDEGPGRRRALQEGLAPYSTLEVLILAKAQGYVDAVQPHLDALIAAGFYLKADLYILVLQKAGEHP